jgi:hypothetical protein
MALMPLQHWLQSHSNHGFKAIATQASKPQWSRLQSHYNHHHGFKAITNNTTIAAMAIFPLYRDHQETIQWVLCDDQTIQLVLCDDQTIQWVLCDNQQHEIISSAIAQK